MRPARIYMAGVHWIGPKCRARWPYPVFPPWARDPHFMQVLNQTIQACVFLEIKNEHLADNRCSCFIEGQLGGVRG